LAAILRDPDLYPTYSSLLSSVRILNIEKDYSSELPTGEEDVDLVQWLELFQQFPHVRLVSVNVDSEQLVLGIVKALVTEDVAERIFPRVDLTCPGGVSPIPVHGWKLSSSSSLLAGPLVAW